MPAQTPQEVHELFAKHFSAGDLDGLMSLYATEALLVQQTGHAVSGHAAIREVLSGFLSRGGQMNLQVRKAFQAGDLALLLSAWELKSKSPTGELVEMSGQTSDVVRRQMDGSWLIVIDIPYGAEAAG